METGNKIVIGIALVLGVIVLITLGLGITGNSISEDDVRIGIITDLSGPAAYWGESTKVGAELALSELRKEGYNVELIYEDAQLDAVKYLNSAQKLVNVNDVDALYVEFNPGSVAVGSFVQNKEILYVYDAAVVSPLEDNDYAYKTYLDYQAGCREVAKKFMNDGFERIGVMKANLEAGELCLAGVREIYENNVEVESYNLDEQDFRTQLLKMSDSGIKAVINIGFEGQTLNILKVIREHNLDMKYGTVGDTITPRVLELYDNELIDSWRFGFSELDHEFRDKISSEDLATEYAAALAYVHIKQIAKALEICNKDLNCAAREMDNFGFDKTVGFRGFEDRIAVLDMEIQNGEKA